MTDPDLSEFVTLTREEDLARQVVELQRKYRKAKAQTEDLIEAVHAGARDAAVLLGNPPAIPKPSRDMRKAKPEVALLHLSDFQTGKETISYNTRVACDRIAALSSKVVKITQIERADHPVRSIHVMLGGDFVEGVAIFPGNAHEVDSSLLPQIFAVVGAVEKLLREQLATFETVVIWCEPGNHGRLGRRGDHPAADNADTLAYALLRERLRDFEKPGRLVWNESQGWHSIVIIGNYRALLVHGDEIKSFGGATPAFGITRKVTAWSAGVVAPFVDAYMGHFHNALTLTIPNGGRIFVNPSTEDGSIYAQEFCASSGTPGQRLNYVDPEKGRVTSERVIWLDETR